MFGVDLVYLFGVDKVKLFGVGKVYLFGVGTGKGRFGVNLFISKSSGLFPAPPTGPSWY